MAYCCFVFAVFGRGIKHETHACNCMYMLQYVTLASLQPVSDCGSAIP